MHLTVLAPHLKVSGGMRIVLTYASLLARRGHRVTVLLAVANPLRRLTSNILSRRVPWILGFRATVRYVPSFDVSHLPPSDVVMATNYQTMDWLHRYPSSTGQKAYLVQHDERMYHGQPEEVDRVWRYPARRLVVSTWLQETLRRDYGFESDLLLNPVDPQLFHSLPRTVDPQTFRVLLLDHTYGWKGTAEGVAIVLGLKQRHPNVRLIMFGARRTRSPYPADEYHFNPPQRRLAWLYSNADAFLCPSWDEGFGLPSVEAMACGCALATYDNGGSRDYAFHEQTALVAPRRDRTALEAQLERLVVDVELHRRLAEAGRRFVAEQLPSWDEQVGRLENLLARQ